MNLQSTLDASRAGIHKVPQQADVPFHQMGHPPAGLCQEIAVQLLYQLGFPEAGRQFAPQQVPQVLQFHFLEIIQNAMQIPFFQLL